MSYDPMNEPKIPLRVLRDALARSIKSDRLSSNTLNAAERNFIVYEIENATGVKIWRRHARISQ
jgi:hypothetical protein